MRSLKGVDSYRLKAFLAKRTAKRLLTKFLGRFIAAHGSVRVLIGGGPPLRLNLDRWKNFALSFLFRQF
jgi:hypothetical protein